MLSPSPVIRLLDTRYGLERNSSIGETRAATALVGHHSPSTPGDTNHQPNPKDVRQSCRVVFAKPDFRKRGAKLINRAIALLTDSDC